MAHVVFGVHVLYTEHMKCSYTYIILDFSDIHISTQYDMLLLEL